MQALHSLLHICSEHEFERRKVLQSLGQIRLRSDADHLLLVVQIKELEILIAHLVLTEALPCALDQLDEAVADLDALGLSV